MAAVKLTFSLAGNPVALRVSFLPGDTFGWAFSLG
jgi:hypothetical protein